ncbi:MAG TPA: hypothetical protein VEP90_00260, partial [Methylomirabilota bacterium]|nr:hypothetical protein [Methylomirabilota bacterium]
VFANLGKDSEFQRMIDHLQRAKDPETGLPGKDLSSVQEVYDFYSTHFGRAPDQIELDGYFAARRGMAQDYIFRNLAIGKNMGRLGNEEHRVYYIGHDGKQYSKWFVGSIVRPGVKDVARTPEDQIVMRLYRGETKGGQRFDPNADINTAHFTEDLANAQKYGDVSYIDVTKKDMMHFYSNAVGNPEGNWSTNNPAFRLRMKPYDPRLLTQSPGIEFEKVNLGGRSLTAARGKGVKPAVDLGIPPESVIAFLGTHVGGVEQIKRAGNFFRSAIGKEVASKVATGEYKIIKMYNTELNSLNGFGNVGNDLIHYVITKNTETRPLSFKQIPQLPGFHIQYD